MRQVYGVINACFPQLCVSASIIPMTITSADRIFGAVARRKDLLTEAQVRELTEVLEQSRQEGERLPIEAVAIDLGFLNSKEIALIFKIRRRYARLCKLCGQVTYILPEESSTPCEFCGPIDPNDSEWVLTESEAYFIGKRIGDYTPLDKGGEERGAKVYLARRDDENRLYVLKVLSIEVKDRVGLTRFIREVDICRNIRHPNVVSVVDAGEFEGNRYLVLEYVEGQSLMDRLEEQGKLPWEEALDILLHVCKGLAVFHDMGVVHRDVKPEKIILGRKGEARISDFALAKELRGGMSITDESEFVGTPLYMTPEAGEVQLMDQRADVYCLGLTFFYILTGHHPFENRGLMDILRKTAHKEIEDPRRFVEELPTSLVRVLGKMVCVDRDLRYPSAREVAHDLMALSLKEEVSVGNANYWPESL